MAIAFIKTQKCSIRFADHFVQNVKKKRVLFLFSKLQKNLLALVGVDEILASSSVETLDRGTFVDVNLAMNSLEARLALALVHVNTIQAIGPI